MLKDRRSGVLLPINHLPSIYGMGDLGPKAYEFVDFLAESGQGYWQVLPLNPVETQRESGFQAPISAFAMDTMLISPQLLFDEGYLDHQDLEFDVSFASSYIDYGVVSAFKNQIFAKAYDIFRGTADLQAKEDFARFCYHHRAWLEDDALYAALKEHYQNANWSQWPEPIRDRQEEALEAMRTKLESSVEKQQFLQYILFRQWEALKGYCRNKGIRILTSLPHFIGHESPDVWSNPHCFKLDSNKQPYQLAVKPTNYYDHAGRNWSLPAYNWAALEHDDFSWWMQRIYHNLQLFDWVQMDNFWAFSTYYEVPASNENPGNGNWVDVPGYQFFQRLYQDYGELPLIAGNVDKNREAVHELKQAFNMPTIKVLQLAFDDNTPLHDHAPHKHEPNCIVYTGTPSNKTIVEWFEKELGGSGQERLAFYTDKSLDKSNVTEAMLHLAMMSVGKLCILKMEDLLNLAPKNQIDENVASNERWLLRSDQLTARLRQQLYQLTQTYGRLGSQQP